MDNKKHVIKTSTVEVDANPLNSKLFMNAIAELAHGKSPSPQVAFEVVDEIINEIYSNLNINLDDIACYVMALDIIRQSLMTHMSDTDKDILKMLQEHSTVTTVHVPQNPKEDNTDEDS